MPTFSIVNSVIILFILFKIGFSKKFEQDDEIL